MPTPWRLFKTWAAIGTQSFGGGSATLYLIRQAAVERYGWLSDEEFAQYWGICQIAPGINILGLASLIGWRVSGAMGVAASLAGLLLPSAAITVALTSIYSSIRNLPLVKAAIAGVVPATVGLGLLLARATLRPMLSSAEREGRASLAVAVILLLASTTAAATTRPPVIAVLWGAGALSALAQWRLASGKRAPNP